MAIKKIKLPDNTTVDINDSRLPAVTATDNGKVLSVSGGIWSANSKPSYTLDEVTDGSTRKLSNYVTIAGTETITGKKTFTGAVFSIKYDNPRIGFYTSAGTLNGVIAYRDAVGPEIYTGSAWNRMYHSGNSNKSNVAWACSTLTTNGDVSVTGNITATGTITPGSDSRIKDNQKEISSECAFSVIENLKPKTWVWNEKSNENLNGKSAAGLVAQEVKEILPDAVTISENGDIKDFHSLNYNTIQGYEIAAIKGLIEEVKSLKAGIAELKKQIK